jgi:hypothetical protein
MRIAAIAAHFILGRPLRVAATSRLADAGGSGLRVSAGCTERKLKPASGRQIIWSAGGDPQRFGSASQRHWQIVKN